MQPNYYKTVFRNLTRYKADPFLHVGGFAAGIALVLILLAAITSGSMRTAQVSPPFSLLEIQDSPDAKEIGKALLTILMFDKAKSQIALGK
jgi:hypothetical protein